MRRILVLDADTGQCLEVVRSLKRRFRKDVEIIAAGQCDFSPARNYVCFSRYVDKTFCYTNPLKNEKSFLKDILNAIKIYNVDVIIPIVEKTMLPLSRIKHELEEQGIIIPIPDYETLQNVVFKDRLLKIAISVGIPVPKTIFVDDIRIVNKIAKEIAYPAVIKLRCEIGIPPPRYAIVRTSSELLQKYIELHKKYPYPLIQEYVKGHGIGAFFCFNKYGELIAFFVHRRILEIPISGGPSAIAESNFNPWAIRYGLKLLKSLNWKGVAMVEFKGLSDRLYLMEVNPRFWGSLPLAIDAGIDFPSLLIEHYTLRKHDCRYNREKIYVKESIMVKVFSTLIDLLTVRNLSELSRYITSILYLLKARKKVAISEMHELKAELIYQFSILESVVNKLMS